DNIRAAPNVSLLSLSAVTTLWSASKGTGAIRTGLETVYHADSSRGYVMQKLWSLVSTLLFIVLIIAVIIVLLFGNFISDLLGKYHIPDFIMWLRFPVAFVLMCSVFCLMYSATAKRGRLVRADFLVHLPGAVFSSIGWILFSFFYSLYITYFPNASYIYGGLAAVCLIMLWIYFCMIILLLGAEVNKLYYIWRDHRSSTKETNGYE
ncbi:MAG: YihY/virulence factor BrkB family protein, partial [Clostridia bacterium]|nr:YihY/virulence factor BrkB family protein [Clostridia bacterium]